MADKAIGELPALSQLQDDSKIPAEQQGQAGYITGRQFADFAREKGAADVQRAVNAADTAETAADKAEAASLHPPYIGANGNWWVYNTATEMFVDSGTGAAGARGATFTPSVDDAGTLSWTNDGGLENPDSVDIVALVLAALPDADTDAY